MKKVYDEAAMRASKDLKAWNEAVFDYSVMEVFIWCFEAQRRDLEIRLFYAKLEPWGA